MLARLAPKTGHKRVFLTNSGAEAVETAIKLARLRTGRQKVVGFFGAFHGRTYGAMTLTASKPVQRKGYGPFVPEILHTHYAYCYRCPVNRDPQSCSVECLELLTETYFHHSVDPKEVAAILVEPIQGEGGFIPPHRDFLPRLQEICRANGILLIADEVQCGMGRTGRLFAFEHYGIDPDMIILAKGIASGMPLSAVIARDDVMKWNDGGARLDLRRQTVVLRLGRRDAPPAPGRPHRERGSRRLLPHRQAAGTSEEAPPPRGRPRARPDGGDRGRCRSLEAHAGPARAPRGDREGVRARPPHATVR